MPLVVGFLPLLGLRFLADPSFHKWMVGVCLALAILAFVPGWRRHHRLTPGITGLIGLSLISFAAFAGPDDCCPTPCAASTPDEASACCTEQDCSTTPAKAAIFAGPTDTTIEVEQEACSMTCCATIETSTDGPAPEENPATMSPIQDMPCTAGCCPTEEDTVIAASAGGFMSMFWLLMTPVGGLILVIAHLTNHRLGCRCNSSNCLHTHEKQLST
jgi:hypothetical protein